MGDSLSKETGSSQGRSCTVGLFSGPGPGLCAQWGPAQALGGPGRKQDSSLDGLCLRPLPSFLRLEECSLGPEHVRRLAAGLSQAWQLTELT